MYGFKVLVVLFLVNDADCGILHELCMIVYRQTVRNNLKYEVKMKYS